MRFLFDQSADFRLIDHLRDRSHDLLHDGKQVERRAGQARGWAGGNPGLRARDVEAICTVQASHDVVHLKAVLGELDTWLSTVRRRLFSDNQPGSLYCLTKRATCKIGKYST